VANDLEDLAHRRSDSESDEHGVEQVVAEVASTVGSSVVDDLGRRSFTRGDVLRLVLAVAIVVLGGAVAAHGLPSWEDDVFRAVNGGPDALYPVLWPVMQLGNLWVATAVGLLAGLVLRSARAAAVLGLVPAAAWLLAKGVKDLVNRGRPGDLVAQAHLRGAPEGGLGYISGHSTIAFAMAAALAAHLRPSYRRLALVLATLVAVARVFVGVHLPLDVVGGAAAGLLVGEAARGIELLLTRHHRPPAVASGPASNR
jgi:undecaprenyl-diphosphatase